MGGCAASELSASPRRPWRVAADRNCPHACPCGLRCARTSEPHKARPPPHPAARSASPPPWTELLRPDAPECALHRSEPPAPTAAWFRLPNLFLLQWLDPSLSPQRSRSSCLYQPPTTSSKSNVRKIAYVIFQANSSHKAHTTQIDRIHEVLCGNQLMKVEYILVCRTGRERAGVVFHLAQNLAPVRHMSLGVVIEGSVVVIGRVVRILHCRQGDGTIGVVAGVVHVVKLVSVAHLCTRLPSTHVPIPAIAARQIELALQIDLRRVIIGQTYRLQRVLGGVVNVVVRIRIGGDIEVRPIRVRLIHVERHSGRPLESGKGKVLVVGARTREGDGRVKQPRPEGARVRC